MRTPAVALAAMALVLGQSTAGHAGPLRHSQEPSGASAPVAATVLPTRAAVLADATRAVDHYYVAGGGASANAGWRWTPYFMAVAALHRATGEPAYRDWLEAWGDRNGWNADAPASPTSNPDSRAAIQVYEESSRLGVNADLTRADRLMEQDLGLPPERYWWIDSLFMGLPLWPTWTRRTGDPDYAAKAPSFYYFLKDQGRTTYRTGCTNTGLFDESEDLWWRDCMYVGRRDALGHKVFWARGNGWVIAALARTLMASPAGDPQRAEYQAMLRRMAARLVSLQGSDGMWRSSLLSPSLHPAPETSGTGLITYALAYGIRTGLLDRATYLPAVTRAWEGMSTIALQDSGALTGCQGVAEAPGDPSTAPPLPYCVGAFGLAATEVALLGRDRARDSFTRTVADGWGTAEQGGPWRTVGPARAFTVVDGAARLRTRAGVTRSALLDGVTSADSDLAATISVRRPRVGSLAVSVIGRRLGGADYRARLVVRSSGAALLQLRRSGAALASARVVGLLPPPGHRAWIRVRLQVRGTAPTALRAKAWRAGSPQPAGWATVRTDAAAGLQGAGSVGLAVSLGRRALPTPLIIAFDSFRAVPPR